VQAEGERKKERFWQWGGAGERYKSRGQKNSGRAFAEGSQGGEVGVVNREKGRGIGGG